MKKVLALLFALALSVSMSSFAFAQADKPADKPMDKMDQAGGQKRSQSKEDQESKESKERRDEEGRSKISSPFILGFTPAPVGVFLFLQPPAHAAGGNSRRARICCA